jgi:SAM-dependent methyltransferase
VSPSLPPPTAWFDAPAVHLAMLADEVRMLAYRAALRALAPGQVVLDLGCGTGVLAIFAAQAGARRVFAVERSEVAGLARLFFKANGVERQVELIRGDARRIALPEPATLLVHELFGSDPLAEGLVPLLDDARARHLAPGALLLPSRLRLSCQGLARADKPAPPQAGLERLGALYGLDLSPLQLLEEAAGPPRARVLAAGGPGRPLTDEARLYDLDLGRDLAAQIAAPASALLEVREEGELGALLLSFQAVLGAGQTLSTGLQAPPTHWGHLVTPLRRGLSVAAGARVPVRALLTPEGEGHRSLLSLG